MALALTKENLYDGLRSQLVSRFSSYLKSPPLAGWRLDPLTKPSLQNQLIRRYFRSDFESANVYFFQNVKEARTARQKEIQQQKEAQELRNNFRGLSEKWRNETTFMSSVSDMVLHPSYLRIIGMGRAVVPLIIEELQREPEHWFQALEAITGQNPVIDADRGRIKKMAQSWIDWAETEKLIA